MRILEETKDYTIFWDKFINYDSKGGVVMNLSQIISCHLIDHKNKKSYTNYGNPFKEDICSLGKKLIKKWKRERNKKC